MARFRKYHNKSVDYDGITFDSKKECDRYKFLKLLETAGEIQNLEVHPKYVIIPTLTKDVEVQMKTKTKIVQKTVFKMTTYTADFRYRVGDEIVVEDVKPSPKAIPIEFKYKQKLMYQVHGIFVKLVYNASEGIDKVVDN